MEPIAADVDVKSAAARHLGGSTPRVDEARRSITRTKVTQGPSQKSGDSGADSGERSLIDRVLGSQHGELTPARQPFPGANVLRLVLATLLSALCLLTVGGAILVLLLWQQDRAAGVLSSQLERTWDLFDMLRQVERWVAFAVIPVATVWIALVAVNVHRATGRRRNPIIAAASLPIGLFGVWIVGSRIVAESSDWVGQAAGFVLQAIFIAIPLLALERLTGAADARHRPLRASAWIAVVYLAQLQFLGGLSTIDQTSAADQWGRIGSYLVIGGLIQVLGALSINEAARGIEEGIDNRFQLRQRFGESLLAQIQPT